MYQFILEKRMTLTSLFSLYFMQFWMAFAYYRIYPNSVFMAVYCPNGFERYGSDELSWFYSTTFYEFSFPIVILIILLIFISSELGFRKKLKWVLFCLAIEIICFILLRIFIIPLPTI